MDEDKPPNQLIIMLQDFLTKCLLCVVTVWNLRFRHCQESGEDKPSENYPMDKFSQEQGGYLERFCQWRTRQERRFKLLQLIYRYFWNSEQENENRERESEAQNNQPVQNETGVFHDMGLRLRIRKGEHSYESRPRTKVTVDHSGCDPVADRQSQGSNTPAASTTDDAVSSPSNSSSALHLLHHEGGILGTSAMPSPNIRTTETTIPNSHPLTPVNKSGTSALAVLNQNSPSQLSKPPASQPSDSDSGSSFSVTMHGPTNRTSPHLDSHVQATESMATECEGARREDPPSQTTEPTDDAGPSAILLHSGDKKISDTTAPPPPTTLKEEGETEGIVAGGKSHSWSNPKTSDTHLKSKHAGKESPQPGPTATWKDSPGSRGTLTQMPDVVAAQAEVQIPKTINSTEPDPKPGRPDRLGKPAFSRLQTSESDGSSSAALTPWTGDARETDKDVHNPASSSSNGPPHNIQSPLSCAESELTTSAASEAATSQACFSSELPEEDDGHIKPESFPSDTVD